MISLVKIIISLCLCIPGSTCTHQKSPKYLIDRQPDSRAEAPPRLDMTKGFKSRPQV